MARPPDYPCKLDISDRSDLARTRIWLHSNRQELVPHIQQTYKDYLESPVPTDVQAAHCHDHEFRFVAFFKDEQPTRVECVAIPDIIISKAVLVEKLDVPQMGNLIARNLLIYKRSRPQEVANAIAQTDDAPAPS